MATYLQGITDYIPQIQPFTPDYNFYSRTLQFKQSKHDAARQQLSNLYGSMLNAPMTREDNINARDKFFKTIEGDIKKLSGMDLSKNVNVQQGQMLFSQLTNNKNIVKDMVWTKHFQNQMARGKNLKNCADPEKCGGSWWEGGDRYMSYKRQEFANATADDAMRMGMVDYVAQQDIMGKASKLAKDAGLSIEIDQLQGGYITTTKNGPLLQGPLSNLFMGSIAKDGKTLDYFRAKAYVERKDFGMSNADQYGSVEAAEQFYIQENSKMLQQLYDQQQATTTDNAETTNKIKTEIADDVKKNGANPKSSVFQIYQDMKGEEQAYQSTSNAYKQASGEVQVAQRSMRGEALDRSMGAFYLGNEINNAAQTLAMKDYKFKMKTDDYSFEAVKQRNRMIMEDIKQKNKLDLEKYKFDLKQYEKQMAARGSSIYNTPTEVTVEGATDGGNLLWMEDGENTYAEINDGANQFNKDRQKLVNDLSAPEKGILNAAYRATESSAEQGNTQAKSDYVNMTLDYLGARSKKDPTTGLDIIGFSAEQDDPNVGSANGMLQRTASTATINSITNARTLDEKYAIAKKAGIDINALSGVDADEMYVNTFEKFAATNDNGENIKRPYLRQVNQMAAEQKEQIKAKREYLAQMDGAYAKMTQGVIEKIKAGKGGYETRMVDAMEAYIDPNTGYARSFAEFKTAYMAKGYTAAQADEIFRQDKQWGVFEERDKDDREDPNNTWDVSDGIYNIVASGVDFAATTGLGALELAKDLGLSILGSGWLWGEGQDFLDRGFDYDSPWDVANWDAPGYSESQNLDGKGNPGLLDTWKRAFSTLADPNADYGWAETHGLGNSSVKGLNFANVDPLYPASVSMLGTTGLLKNAFSSSNAIFSMGDFSANLPDESNDDAKRLAALAYTDLTQNPKGASRLTPNVTYTHIAGGDDNWVGMNIKFSEKYVQGYKGSEDDAGPTRGITEDLVTKGITMYVPKSDANNIFTSNAEKTSLDLLMDYAGEVKVESSPKYTKGVRITKAPGGYIQEGILATGINDDGSYNWENFQQYLPNQTNLTDAFNNLNNNLIIPVDQQMAMMEKQWNLTNGIKNIE